MEVRVSVPIQSVSMGVRAPAFEHKPRETCDSTANILNTNDDLGNDSSSVLTVGTAKRSVVRPDWAPKRRGRARRERRPGRGLSPPLERCLVSEA